MLDYTVHMTKPDKHHTYAKQRIIIVFTVIHCALFREIHALLATAVVTEPLMLLGQ
jgi:hypothetical protein